MASLVQSLIWTDAGLFGAAGAGAISAGLSLGSALADEGGVAYRLRGSTKAQSRTAVPLVYLREASVCPPQTRSALVRGALLRSWRRDDAETRPTVFPVLSDRRRELAADSRLEV